MTVSARYKFEGVRLRLDVVIEPDLDRELEAIMEANSLTLEELVELSLRMMANRHDQEQTAAVELLIRRSMAKDPPPNPPRPRWDWSADGVIGEFIAR